jgi:ABC-type multidrug transport system ATPase subunit
MTSVTPTLPHCLYLNQALIKVRSYFELHVSLTVPCGQKILLAGDNGAGKTTFLKVCAGLLIPNSGTFERTCGNVGLYLGDTSMLYQDLSFAENAKIFLSFKKPDSRSDAPPDLGLSSKDQHRPVRELSAGSRMKASLGITFALGSEVLLLDEPSAFLDAAANESLISYLDSCDRTMIIATHDVALFTPVCSRRITLASGKIVEDTSI